MSKGILKKPKDIPKPENTGIQWDEANLMLNESEKVPRMKVDEPKTPFVYYDSDGDDVQGMRSHDQGLLPPSELQKALSKAIMEIDVEPFNQKQAIEEPYIEEEEEELTEEQKKKHAEFKKNRSKHYDMGNALKRGKQLIETEDEDEEDDDENDHRRNNRNHRRQEEDEDEDGKMDEDEGDE